MTTTAPRAAAVIIGALTASALVTAPAQAAGPSDRGQVSGHSNPGMERMHELHMQGGPGMERMQQGRHAGRCGMHGDDAQ